MRPATHTLLRFLAAVTLVLGLLPNGVAQDRREFEARRTGLTTRQWRADLEYLRMRVPLIHRNAFHAVTESQWNKSVKQVKAMVGRVSEDRLLIELGRLISLIGDGHTGLVWQPEHLRMHTYPIELRLFDEGLFVVAADRRYEAAVGARVVSIGGIPADELVARASEIVESDNRFDARERVPYVLRLAEVLQGLGASSRADSAELMVENRGKRFTTVVQGTASDSRSWARMSPSDITAPLWLQHPDEPYWMEAVPDAHLLYVQLNAIADKPEGQESLAAFFSRALALAEANAAEKLVLDLRLNRGGNKELNSSILHALIRSQRFAKRGTLFVITGGRTFSAAMNLANDLDKDTRAVFVGEPTGGRPNSYGDAELLTLPNSRVQFLIATAAHQDQSWFDVREAIAPELFAPIRAVDYQRGSDPALEAIRGFQARPRLIWAVNAVLAPGDLSKVQEKVEVALREGQHPLAAEQALAELDYILPFIGKRDLMAPLARFAVGIFPGSSNCYTRLGDACRLAEDTLCAREAYARALHLDRRNEYARVMYRRYSNGAIH